MVPPIEKADYGQQRQIHEEERCEQRRAVDEVLVEAGCQPVDVGRQVQGEAGDTDNCLERHHREAGAPKQGLLLEQGEQEDPTASALLTTGIHSERWKNPFCA